MNEPDSALLYLQKSVEYARRGNYKVALIEALLKLGLQYERVTEYPLAAQVYGEALYLAQTLSNDEFQGRSHSALGKLFTIIGDHESALKHLKNGVRFLEKTSNANSLFTTYSNICEIYSNKIVNRDSALQYSALAEKAVPESRKSLIEYVNAVNLGTLYFNLDQQDSAIVKFQEAYTNPLNSRLSAENATTLLNIGANYFSKGTIDSALTFLNDALDEAEQLDLFELKIMVLEQLFNIDRIAGNTAGALEKQIAINQAAKQLRKTESRNILARNQIERERMTAQYKLDLLEVENEAQKQHIEVQKTRIYLIGLFLVVTILLMAVLVIQYRSKILAFRKLAEKNRALTILQTKKIEQTPESTEYEAPPSDTAKDESGFQYTIQRLESLMAREKIFLNPDISADDLSKALNVNRRSLSTLLSSKYQMNFNEFINHYRILEAQRLIMDLGNQNLTMKTIFEQCGFKSERTFYNAFKNYTGISPKMFQESKMYQPPQR